MQNAWPDRMCAHPLEKHMKETFTKTIFPPDPEWKRSLPALTDRDTEKRRLVRTVTWMKTLVTKSHYHQNYQLVSLVLCGLMSILWRSQQVCWQLQWSSWVLWCVVCSPVPLPSGLETCWQVTTTWGWLQHLCFCFTCPERVKTELISRTVS